jgi:hypothetical protein
MTGSKDLEVWIESAIAESRGKPVLLLGDAAPGLQGGDVTRISHLAPGDAVPGEGRRFDLAVVAGVLENLDPEAAAALLAALRDLTASRLLVAVPARSGNARERSVWLREDMLAHGLEYLGAARHHSETLAIYGFDLDRYKRTPDWLNARSWANPENWGKYRW